MHEAESQASVATGDAADRIRTLATEHHTLDQRLQELEARPHLTEEETLEETRIKKRKLAVKDEMSRLSHES